MIYIKRNNSQGSEVLAVCDKNLIGKTFRGKGLKLEITEKFYKGKLVNEEKLLDLIKNAKNINIAGKDSIKIAVKNNVVKKEDVIKIKNIPHAIIFEI